MVNEWIVSAFQMVKAQGKRMCQLLLTINIYVGYQGIYYFRVIVFCINNMLYNSNWVHSEGWIKRSCRSNRRGKTC